MARSIGGPRTCSGLSDLGRRQCERLATRLSETGELSDVVLYASRYPRAIETAELIAPAFGDAPVHVEPGFGEHDPGPDSDGLTFDEFLARHGMPDWESDAHAVTFPGGETLAELHHRVGIAVHDVVVRPPRPDDRGLLPRWRRQRHPADGAAHAEHRWLRAVHDERLAHRAAARAARTLAPASATTTPPTSPACRSRPPAT